MNRFMGMMPVSEIVLSETYVDQQGLKIRVDAGPNGWTIKWADHSTTYADVVRTPEDNLLMATAALRQTMPEVVLLKPYAQEEQRNELSNMKNLTLLTPKQLKKLGFIAHEDSRPPGGHLLLCYHPIIGMTVGYYSSETGYIFPFFPREGWNHATYWQHHNG